MPWPSSGASLQMPDGPVQRLRPLRRSIDAILRRAVRVASCLRVPTAARAAGLRFSRLHERLSIHAVQNAAWPVASVNRRESERRWRAAAAGSLTPIDTRQSRWLHSALPWTPRPVREKAAEKWVCSPDPSGLPGVRGPVLSPSKECPSDTNPTLFMPAMGREVWASSRSRLVGRIEIQQTGRVRLGPVLVHGIRKLSRGTYGNRDSSQTESGRD